MSLRLSIKTVFFLILISIVTSCKYFNQGPNAKVVAKVHEVNLYDYDLKQFNVPKGLGEKDSVSVLMEHINDWATKQLILHEAKKNMTQKKQLAYNNLVEEYRLDLFSSAYENAYVKKNLKTTISKQEIALYYKKFEQNFVLQEDLVQLRYIQLPEKYKNLRATKAAFKRFNSEDVEELNKLKLGFVSSNFNLDNEWVVFDSVLEKIPSLTFFNKKKIIRNNYFLNYKSEKSRFLIQFKRVLKVGQIAPVAYVEEQIKQIILNKRKIALKKQLKKEIRKDALQTKEYQIFE